MLQSNERAAPAGLHVRRLQGIMAIGRNKGKVGADQIVGHRHGVRQSPQSLPLPATRCKTSSSDRRVANLVKPSIARNHRSRYDNAIGAQVSPRGGPAADLREATRALHDRAERSGIIARMLRGKASVDAYAMLLRNLLPVYRALEEGLVRHCETPGLRLVARPELAPPP